ncbi:MAG: M48 family metallopeptidase [Planctomycetaceae bacterium]
MTDPNGSGSVMSKSWQSQINGKINGKTRRFGARSAIFAMVLLVPVVTTLFVTGCQQVPESGRKRLVLLSSESKENEMGLTAYKEVLETEKVTSNQSYVEMVRRVGNRIAAVANRPDFDWEFNVIESETQNAFCLPGGKVAVYTGILPVCKDEAGLAVVMSHEVAHAIARHGGERMTYQTAQNLGKAAVGYVTQTQDEQKQKIVLAAYGAASEYGVILPYSRTHELEADSIGIMLMARAGYDPSSAPEFWQRFAEMKEGGQPMEWMSTHPSDSTRSANLRELVPQAVQLYEKSPQKFGLGEPIR